MLLTCRRNNIDNPRAWQIFTFSQKKPYTGNNVMSGSRENVASEPSAAAVVSTLRDGYWDRTDLIRLEDGCLRVRKVSRGAEASGPWGTNTLRREIEYMRRLQGDTARWFPVLLAAWDNGPDLGYEMSFIPEAADVGSLAQEAAFTQPQADLFQDTLGHVVFHLLHQPLASSDELAVHVRDVMFYALSQLEHLDEFHPILSAKSVQINGHTMPGLHRAAQKVMQKTPLLDALAKPPCVCLHGDLFLENILLPQNADNTDRPARLTLLDPVSVAGVFRGHPLFDLVKYESYATGELLALRAERLVADGFDSPEKNSYTYHILGNNPAIRPFLDINWHSRFRAAYVSKYGAVHLPAYHLLDAYFALAMSLTARSLHRRGRVLKATLAINKVLKSLASSR